MIMRHNTQVYRIRGIYLSSIWASVDDSISLEDLYLLWVSDLALEEQCAEASGAGPQQGRAGAPIAAALARHWPFGGTGL